MSSPVRAAITDAARHLGHDDPVAVVDELTAVEVDALRRWRAAADATQRSLANGSDRLGHARSVLADAWSSPAPVAAVQRHRDAGRAAGLVIDRHLAAALETIDTLESTRASARSELANTEDGIRGTGWPPGEDLLTWATVSGHLPAVTATIGALVAAVRQLRTRNDAALRMLAAALRVDPAAPVDSLAATMPAAFPGVVAEPVPRTGPPIDQVNLNRLAADLRSDDPIVVLAAVGVRDALDRARSAGGSAQLLVYEPASGSSQGRAAISTGDIARADDVVVMAPGVSSSLREMGDGVHDALTLAERSHAFDPNRQTVAVSWYGYETPLSVDGGTPMDQWSSAVNLLVATNDGRARVGGQQLVEDLAGFRALAPDGARFVGYGHSMGSTVISAAAARGARFDDVILAGSPGASVEVDSVADYPGMTPGHVWVNSFENDPITGSLIDSLAGFLGANPLNPLQPSSFGPDPAAADFGAKVLDVSSNQPDEHIDLGGGPIAVLPSAVLNTIDDLGEHHNGGNYLTGPSLDATAAIVAGHYDEVPLRPGR